MDFTLREIWLQALQHTEPDIINRLKNGEIFKFNIESKIQKNIPPKWKTYYISLCTVCKKGVIFHLTRPVKYCPLCAQENKNEKQRQRRAFKQKRRLCKCCGKPLPKDHPNRVYCPGGTCKQKEYRRRKKWENFVKDFNESVV